MTAQGWWDYFIATAGTADGATIAAAAGVSTPQVSRWKTGINRPDADKVVRFARHYGKPPLEGLIAAGYISVQEAGAIVTVPRPVEELSDDELLAEIRHRMEGAHRGMESDETTRASVEGGQTQEESNDAEPASGLARLQSLSDRVRVEGADEEHKKGG